ncbi:hypothetical protein BC830DRAFT_1134868 [Chytriomyces sp. MP71]|nr:hypothetical protein BC830DRAFT_1134868 [Chytriomyces sp. MP71]
MAPASLSSPTSLCSPIFSMEPVMFAQPAKPSMPAKPSLPSSPKLATDMEDKELHKTQKRAGRKFTDTEPASKRIAQNRIAQRLHRERKQKQVQDLEEQVKCLTAIVAAYESVSGLPYPATANAASLSPEKSSESSVVQQLSAKILLLQAENNLLKACFSQLGHGTKAQSANMITEGVPGIPGSGVTSSGDGMPFLQDFSLFSTRPGGDLDSHFLTGSAAVNQASLLQPWFSPATSVHSDVALLEELSLQHL